MTATAQNFIRLFQMLPLLEQQSVTTWIDSHKNDLEKGVLDAAFAPMTTNEANELWQSLNLHSLFSDWSEQENDIWTNYIKNLDNAPNPTQL